MEDQPYDLDEFDEDEDKGYAHEEHDEVPEELNDPEDVWEKKHKAPKVQPKGKMDFKDIENMLTFGGSRAKIEHEESGTLYSS